MRSCHTSEKGRRRGFSSALCRWRRTHPPVSFHPPGRRFRTAFHTEHAPSTHEMARTKQSRPSCIQTSRTSLVVAKPKGVAKTRRSASKATPIASTGSVDEGKTEEILLNVGKALECSLSGALLVDPVVADDGRVYERCKLREWIRSRHTSPLAGRPVENFASCKQIENTVRYYEQCHKLSGEGNRSKSAAVKSFVDSVKEELTCPILQEVPASPVLACDGRIYDGDALQQWFQKRNHSPMTNLPIERRVVPLGQIKDLLIGTHLVGNVVSTATKKRKKGTGDSWIVKIWNSNPPLRALWNACQGSEASVAQ